MTGPRPARGAGSTGGPAAGPPPSLVLVTGPEEVLAQRAVTATVRAVRAVDAEAEVIRIDAAGYDAGALTHHASPSLFGGAKVLVVRGVEEAGDDLVQDLLAYLDAPAPDETTLIVCHAGGNRARKILDRMRSARAAEFAAAAIKSDRDKGEFVQAEFRAASRPITAEAIRALVEAVGKDVTELASACAQLVADTEGVVDEEVVARYHGGRVEATGFRVADAALAGQSAQALRLLRHALSAGVDPVPIVAVLASQLRQLVKVAGAGRGTSAHLAKALGMAPWQVDRARRSLAGWDDAGLGTAIQAVAAADFEVKGGGRDPVYAVERAVVAIAQARRGR